MKAFPAFLLFFVMVFGVANSYASDEDEFKPAYENMDQYDVEDPRRFYVRHEGRNYYTSGKEDGFRVNENNEESTDETIGILTFLLAPFTILYMNIIGWWD